MFFVQKYWTKFVWIYSIGLFFPQVVIKYANMPIFNYSSSLKKNKKNLVNRFRKFWCLVLLDWSLKSNESDLPLSLGFDILICCKYIQPDSRSISWRHCRQFSRAVISWCYLCLWLIHHVHYFYIFLKFNFSTFRLLLVYINQNTNALNLFSHVQLFGGCMFLDL